ncbi:MAG: ferredoxin reductase family protein [Chloroflexota bacterium]
MKIRGLIIICIANAIPLIWYGPLIAQGNGTAALGQYLGVVALILMSITQLIATRINGIEATFGSLDRVYVLHKWLAVIAIVASFLHENMDPDIGNIALIAGINDNAEDLGELSYNGLLVLVGVSLITIIPYRFWRWSHRLIGIFFALAAAHYLLIEKPFAVFEPSGLYITAFCVIGILSYLYLLIPREVGHNSLIYQVADVVEHQDVIEVHLTPQGKGITHKAGQFAFVNFKPLNLHETHPYTISNAPNPQGTLRFMVKGLGSYTKRIGQVLEPGMTARVSNSFGHFTLTPTDGPQIWIAGGIGITPFMAWVDTLPPNWSMPTRLYYCVRNPEDVLQLPAFEQAAATVDNFDFSLVVSQRDKRLTAEQIVADLRQDIRIAHVYFCGAESMRESLSKGLAQQGLPRSHFHYEEFEMRTSLGLVRLVRRFLN